VCSADDEFLQVTRVLGLGSEHKAEETFSNPLFSEDAANDKPAAKPKIAAALPSAPSDKV
jgi:hypothetical protein